MVKLGVNVLMELLEEGFFNEWKNMSEILKKLSQRGYTVSGKKVSNVAQTLTRMCRNKQIGLERDLLPENEWKESSGKWKYKKVR